MARQIDPRQRVTDIIEDVGGSGELATLLKVSQSVVCNWRARGDIPRRYWQQIIKLSGGAVTAARLAGVVE